MNQCSVRARYLWLLGCGSRTAIFGRLERLIFINLLMPVTMVAALMVSLHFVVVPLTAGRIAAAILLVAGVVPIAVYVCLIRLRNLGFREIGLASIAGAVSFGLYLGYARGGWGLSVVIAGFIAEVAVAAGLRYWTRRRWQRVDWLELKAVRPGKYSIGLIGTRQSTQ